MNWVFLVLLGGAVNACVNYGYKFYGSRLNISYLIGMVMAVGAVGTAAYAYFSGAQIDGILQGFIPIFILLMGSGMAIVWILMVTALTRGPISLVDPMWACIYALVSVLIGMGVAAETPKLISLVGVAVYLIGVTLIAVGARKTK